MKTVSKQVTGTRLVKSKGMVKIGFMAFMAIPFLKCLTLLIHFRQISFRYLPQTIYDICMPHLTQNVFSGMV